MSSLLGRVKGWWTAVHEPSSVLARSGKSTTQRKLRSVEPLVRSIMSAISSRVRPRMVQVDSHSPATKKTMSPSSMLRVEMRAAFSVSVKNFQRGLLYSPFSHLMKASVLTGRPAWTASSLRRFIWPVVMPAKPLALMALTTPPFSSVDLKILNSVPAKTLARSMSVMPKRVSGLSMPY